VADLSRELLRRFARAGAQARLEELRAEEAAIHRAFPGLSAKPRAANAGRRRGRMSAAARKAVSERMKKYWAERRKAKGKK
jgi:hypothetical protein